MAVVAAVVSYQHGYEVVRARGETGSEARLVPLTVDGLIYASSMVLLHSARRGLPVPGLARWLLGVGITATLAANVAYGWAYGPVGAAVAAWHAIALVGSSELLMWLIRTQAAGPVNQQDGPAQAWPEPAGTGARTGVTETVYRHAIAPSVKGSASVMDNIFG